MMTFRQLIALWAIVSAVTGTFWAISHPESMSHSHTYLCVLLFILFSILTIAIVEIAGSRLCRGYGDTAPRRFVKR